MLAPFWGPVSREFTPPIEYGRPTMGGVAAFKLQQVAGNWKLTPAWLSRDIDLAEETVIANGVVFAYGAGEDATQTVPDNAWDEPTPGTMGGGLSSGADAAFRARGAPSCWRSTDRPARNSGRAARRSRRGTTSVD